MDCQGESVFSCSRLLHPELFGREEIMQILKTYCIPDSKLNGLSHDELLNLFNRIALPLPQRQYNDSWRGKYLMSLRSKQQSCSQKLKAVSTQKVETKSQVTNNGVHTPRTSNSSNVLTRTERTKPPVDLINYERKKINLTKVTKSSSQLKNDSRNELEKIVIKNRNKEPKIEEKTAPECQMNSKDSPVSKRVTIKRLSGNSKEPDESTPKKAKVLVS